MRTLQASELPDLVNLLTTADDSRQSRLVLLDDSDPRLAVDWQQALHAVREGGYVAVVVRLESSGNAQRLLQFLGLPVRLRRAERTLRRAGIGGLEQFAVSPDLRQPVFIYSLRRAAAAYARNSFLPAHHGAGGALRRFISWWAGCDVSVSAVLVVGRLA